MILPQPSRCLLEISGKCDVLNSVRFHIKSDTFSAVGGRYIQEQPDELFDIFFIVADLTRLTVLARSCQRLVRSAAC